MNYLDRVGQKLEGIRAAHQERTLPERQLVAVTDFASNDYLGLASDPQVVEALKRAHRAGSGGARLLSGRHREHSLLEAELADWLGRERALLFSSGYLAAVGTIPVLAAFGDVVLSDACNHASIIDGVRLARTRRIVYPHRTLPPTGGVRAMIVSESIFSMDGDAADARTLLGRCGDDGIVLLDEAHALGIVGAQGGGGASGCDDPRLVVLGTLSKALGTLGGFVAGPASVVELLVNRARTFVFDTALPPALVLAARIALVLARRADDARARLRANVQRLHEGLAAASLPSPDVAGAIVPLILGSEERTLRVSAALMERRIFVPAIRPPTVQPNTSRLRISLRADHSPEQIDLLVEALRACIVTS